MPQTRRSWRVYDRHGQVGWIVHASAVHRERRRNGMPRPSILIMVEQGSLSDASPARALVSSYVVGQDADGHWLAIEEHGRGGGLFASKDAALRYVGFETSRAPGCCRLASEPVDLSFERASVVAPALKAA